jgi:hypothetical protein
MYAHKQDKDNKKNSLLDFMMITTGKQGVRDELCN